MTGEPGALSTTAWTPDTPPPTRADIDALVERTSTYTYTPPVISPSSYAHAQKILGLPPTAQLTEQQLWEAYGIAVRRVIRDRAANGTPPHPIPAGDPQ